MKPFLKAYDLETEIVNMFVRGAEDYYVELSLNVYRTIDTPFFYMVLDATRDLFDGENE